MRKKAGTESTVNADTAASDRKAAGRGGRISEHFPVLEPLVEHGGDPQEYNAVTFMRKIASLVKLCQFEP